MILDRNNKKIQWGDIVRNIDTNKVFQITNEMEIVLNHSEIIDKNYQKIWKYNHLEKINSK